MSEQSFGNMDTSARDARIKAAQAERERKARAQCWESAFCRAVLHKPGCPYATIGSGVSAGLEGNKQP